MILTILAIVLIVLSLLIILSIVLRKFPVLAILDVNNMPGEKEAKFKDQILQQKLERDLSKFSGALGRFFLAFSKWIASFLEDWQEELKKAKLSYKRAARIPLAERQKRIKELLISYEDEMRKEDYQKAEEKLLEVITLDQKNLNAFYRLGELYDTQKKWPEARQTYEYSLKLAKQYWRDTNIMGDLSLQQIYFSLAWVEREAGDLDAALENALAALDFEPNSPRYLDLILDLSIMRKDKERAQAYLEKLAAVNPENKKLEDWQAKIEEL